MIYFDSAYVAKYYLTEPDSARVRALAESDGRVCCSIVGRVEVAQVFHRKRRERALTRAAAAALFEQYDADLNAGLWTWLPMTDDVLDQVVEAFRQMPTATAIRSVDALHLVTARQHGFEALYTNDAQMLTAAPAFTLRGLSV